MRMVKLFLVLSVFLTACATNEGQEAETTIDTETAVEVEEEIVDETDATPEPLTAEEKLISELPEGVSSQDWELILVNPEQALPADFEIDLAEVDNEQQIDRRIVDTWYSWKEAALQAGHRLFFASGYRDVERQERNFNRTVQEHVDEGLSEEEAFEKAKEYLTEPGHSEHHTGLALDIVDEEWIVSGQGLEPEYENEASQQWLVDTMTDYGFILRYPAGKEDITEINYEPWHFRYVGVENAKFIVENELTLEEYVELLIRAEE